uniref:Uncharacterized protein n=1 Tax=Ditylenchus dipsaci TaxID=166011 RepID=A0A915DUC2_9BILA
MFSFAFPSRLAMENPFPGEYDEQREFGAVLAELVKGLPANAEHAALEQGVHALRQAIDQRLDGPAVSRQARQLGARLAVAYERRGRWPAGVGLEPAPANLRDVARLDQLSLFDLYNTLALGIDGTEMPSFADQLDDRQRWDVAAYIASFTAKPEAGKGDKTWNIADWPARPRPKSPPTKAQRPWRHSGPSVPSRRRSSVALRNCSNTPPDGLPVGQVEQRLGEAKVKLEQAAKLLGSDGLSWSLSYVSGLLILLREGLEAILVLAAILAFLRNTGQQSAVRSVNIGWGLALVAASLPGAGRLM